MSIIVDRYATALEPKQIVTSPLQIDFTSLMGTFLQFFLFILLFKQLASVMQSI
jgi:hypothetical protein